ncbi:serine hydrolase domain-containing protein [Fictibacillus sp. Mic-4]|uniref:serine hydrolase domain-containing protein n=1 Tax=Fictibacillus sp. Mic-4 TaxID=3132826 RepID=UPI003CE8447E
MRKESRIAKRKRDRRKKLQIFSCSLLLLGGIYFFYHKLSAPIQRNQANIVKKQKLKKAIAALKMPSNQGVDDYLKRIHFNGTALVVKNGKTILNKGYGFADRERRIRNNRNTVYYIGSITKSFISTAIMQLQAQGKLNVHDRLSNYLPTFPHANEITLYNLLTHTSAIPTYRETWEKLAPNQLINRIAFRANFLLFPPGTRWNYSDSNYSILGYIVEKVSGQPLHNYLQEHIFQVAGMKHSGFGYQMNNEPFPSKGYKIQAKKIFIPGTAHFSQLYGCGDIYTTAYDLYKFDHALKTGKLVSPLSYEQIFTPFKHDYGFGWYVKSDKYFSHGVLPGWNGLNSYAKDGSVYVVLLSNIQNNIRSIKVVDDQIFKWAMNPVNGV